MPRIDLRTHTDRELGRTMPQWLSAAMWLGTLAGIFGCMAVAMLQR